ncbi:hypothetical protein [Shewanella frigidimarina]
MPSKLKQVRNTLVGATNNEKYAGIAKHLPNAVEEAIRIRKSNS